MMVEDDDSDEDDDDFESLIKVSDRFYNGVVLLGERDYKHLG